MAEANHMVRRYLLERLRSIGLCPDQVNDRQAVLEVARQSGCSVEEVAGELVKMRTESSLSVFRRMGVAVPPANYLASLVATQEVIARAARSEAADFLGVYRKFRGSSAADLMRSLDGISPGLAETRRRDRAGEILDRMVEMERP